MAEGTQVQVRVDDDLLEIIDEWRRGHPNPPTRPEAIRRLSIKGLPRELRDKLKGEAS